MAFNSLKILKDWATWPQGPSPSQDTSTKVDVHILFSNPVYRTNALQWWQYLAKCPAFKKPFVAQIPMNLRGQNFYLLTICFLVLYLYDCIEWQLWSSKDKAVMQLLTWITFVNTFMHAYQIHLWLFLVYNVVYFLFQFY